ncbi:FAD binding protein [Pleurocapsa sp. PCC 7327]|uniref:FAD-dependent oxidoreductase n=1 Tax=Pleurocapsa sp. PCC 7327 TaxID=118163 RepID=UPI00029FF317|nr:FAD-dependent oxidoreductase [Pleurocapsa sp. PCC 7327]AFY78822.1 FAD binding protein [Pleurocapsa sp. PCC 7327]
MIAQLSTDVLVVGTGTGGTAAAIQAARRGVQTILVSEFAWLGGMLTAAGVCAPDGNELAAFQTGLWGAYLQALRHRQRGGLDNSWVSLFAYDPRTGAKIFADWVKQLPNLHWISGQTPLEVIRRGDRIIGVRFADYIIKAKITIDGTELGDLLALAEVPHRWGWELQSEFNEPSAPTCFNELTNKYPVQAPTWVFILKDYGDSPSLFPSPHFSLFPSSFQGAWSNYGGEKFLNYGRLPGGLFMINWPICGNDYGERMGRLIESETSRQEFLQQAYWHSYNFAHFIQTELGQRYGLAQNIFPQKSLHHSFALHPYYRESRRIRGQVTIAERDILPVNGGCVAALPRTENGEVSAIAIGNYANDHHYPGINFPLQPKSIRWGGRWTGTPFTIPYGSLVPTATEGLLVCEKNISVSHIANGCTRLQPVVMNIGQAAGMAAALCIELDCQPQEIPIRSLQEALLTDSIAPSAVIPLFDLPPEHGDWLYWQKYYLDHPEDYPLDGNCHCQEIVFEVQNCSCFTGVFHSRQHQQYSITLTEPTQQGKKTWSLITTRPEVNLQLQNCRNGQLVSLLGQCNFSGGWLVVEKIRI